MTRLNPEKLNVEFGVGVTQTEPVIGRKYTLTHSDLTAELFLAIGLEYAYDNITAMRDEVLAEWQTYNNVTYLFGYVYVDSQLGELVTKIRNTVFRKELPLALEAIRYGDDMLFIEHPDLDQSQIWIHFYSSDPEYNSFEYWGTPQDYK